MILLFTMIALPPFVLLGFVVGFRKGAKTGASPTEGVERRRKLAGAAGRTAVKLAGKAAMHWLGGR